MNQALRAAFSNGYERMAAWSGLLDDINLFPVADADTGRNLRISLASLKSVKHHRTANQLLVSATGNSGNIAGAFFSKFIEVENVSDFYSASKAGTKAAWCAVSRPRSGTMLSVFKTLTVELRNIKKHIEYNENIIFEDVLAGIVREVLSTAQVLPELSVYKVIDSGALGMFFFFEGFFRHLSNTLHLLCNPYDLFGENLIIEKSVSPQVEPGERFCIDTVIVSSEDIQQVNQKIAAMGKHVISVSDGERIKIHLHTDHPQAVKQDLDAVGNLIRWQAERTDRQKIKPLVADKKAVHIVTDAAGSLAAEVARQLDIYLLDSYIIIDDLHLPESMVSPEILYSAMNQGKKVTTAQASVFERHQQYQYITQRYRNIVYLCVGSVYTGNWEIASQWVADTSNKRGMTVVDTGAASGRLGLIARRVAQYAGNTGDLQKVIQYSNAMIQSCDEIIFLDQLKYLAAGGRISKTSRFFGDLIKIKPIIRPSAQGAQKVGVVKKHQAQVEFALDYLGNRLRPDTPVDIILQYTDNYDRVVSQIQPKIEAILPASNISIVPMSITSGAHMGPGTWALAFLPWSEKDLKTK